MKYKRKKLIKVLITHQRMEDGTCLCGWGKVGLSFARHIADTYENKIL